MEHEVWLGDLRRLKTWKATEQNGSRRGPNNFECLHTVERLAEVRDLVIPEAARCFRVRDQ